MEPLPPPGPGVVFGFMDDRWPDLPRGSTSRALLYSLIFVVLVAGLMLPFIWDEMRQVCR